MLIKGRVAPNELSNQPCFLRWKKATPDFRGALGILFQRLLRLMHGVVTIPHRLHEDVVGPRYYWIDPTLIAVSVPS